MYFHETKKMPSYFGGQVTGYRLVEGHKRKKPYIVFEMTAMLEGRGQSWTGKVHSRARYSIVL